MKYGIFADVHSNFDAAEVVIDFLKHRTDQLLCVGDIVGYGAQPNECIDLVKNSVSISIAGNHDWASVGLLNLNYFNSYAKRAIIWTQNKLSDVNKEYLRKLNLVSEKDEFIHAPESHGCKPVDELLSVQDSAMQSAENKAATAVELWGFALVHGSLDKPSDFNYIFGVADSVTTFDKMKTWLCFVAHSHVPLFLYRQKQDIGFPRQGKIEYNSEMRLEREKKYVINVGSVGQPRDADPRACCVILDEHKESLMFYRLEYPVVAAQKKILKTDLPQIFSSRLSVGR